MRIKNPPKSDALMATARSFGNYTLSSALADLIDNSIAAKAMSVSVTFEQLGHDVCVSIADDGEGMTGSKLKEAMRPASSHPDEKRLETDLGRFGWGMKSASLSQARKVTVVSWKDDHVVAARWDLDDIDDWEMDFFQGKEAKLLLRQKNKSKSGTEVIWENTDRLVESLKDDKHGRLLSAAISAASDDLGLIFHRYLQGKSTQKLVIKINNEPVIAADPFLEDSPATQPRDREKFPLGNKKYFFVQPFILPHFSKLSNKQQELIGGKEGMAKNQGFYVYRANRLILHGTWFGLVPHRELSQLTRIKVDLPNNMDEDWKVTIDKSGAQLPLIVRQRLRSVVASLNEKSKRVHQKKGIRTSSPINDAVWIREQRNGRVTYRINRNHPIVKSTEQNLLDLGSDFDIDPVYKLIESYLPVDVFQSDVAEKNLCQTVTDENHFTELVIVWVMDLIRVNPDINSIKKLKKEIRRVEPFSSHWKFVESIIDEKIPVIMDK